MSIIHLWNLPPNEVYLELERNYKVKMLRSAKNLANTYKGLAKILREPLSRNKHPYTVIDFNLGHAKASLKLIIKLSKFLVKNGYDEFKMSEIEKHVTKICCCKSEKGAICNPKLPFDFKNPAGVRFIAAILFDGGIKSRLVPFYSNNDLKMKKKIKKCAKDIFGNFFSNSSDTNHQTIVFPRIMGFALVHGLKMPVGKKVFTNPSVPKFIFSLDGDLKSIFLQQAFDDDGTVCQGKIKLALSIDVSSSEEKIVPSSLLDTKKLLETLKIRVSGPRFVKQYLVKKNSKVYKRHSYSIVICDRKSLEIFKKKIDFALPHKRKTLKSDLKKLKYYRTPPNQKFAYYLGNAKKVKTEHGIITTKLLMEETKRSYTSCIAALNVLAQRGLLKRYVKNRKGGGIEYAYDLPMSKEPSFSRLLNPLTSCGKS